MAVTFTLRVKPPPPELCIPDNAADWITSGEAITLEQSGVLAGLIIYRQNTPPTDRTAVWLKEDAEGNLLGMFTYQHGEWRRLQPVGKGTRMYYSGPVGGFFDPITLLGIHGQDYDGWKIDTGFADRIVIIGALYDQQQDHWLTGVTSTRVVEQDGSFSTQVSNTPSGGTAAVSLSVDQIPRIVKPALETTMWEGDHNHVNPAGSLWGKPSGGHASTYVLIPPDNGNMTPIPVPILPPWIAQAMIVYVGTGLGT